MDTGCVQSLGNTSRVHVIPYNRQKQPRRCGSGLSLMQHYQYFSTKQWLSPLKMVLILSPQSPLQRARVIPHWKEHRHGDIWGITHIRAVPNALQGQRLCCLWTCITLRHRLCLLLALPETHRADVSLLAFQVAVDNFCHFLFTVVWVLDSFVQFSSSCSTSTSPESDGHWQLCSVHCFPIIKVFQITSWHGNTEGNT